MQVLMALTILSIACVAGGISLVSANVSNARGGKKATQHEKNGEESITLEERNPTSYAAGYIKHCSAKITDDYCTTNVYRNLIAYC